MPDITMCDNDRCPMRNNCYRFIAVPTPNWQSFAHYEPIDGLCDHLLPVTRKDETGETLPRGK